MWGSTTPDTNNVCNWANTPFNGGASSYDAEYFIANKSKWLDDNDNLKLEYDAARAIMGGDWRMPTKADFEELLNNTTVEETTINGVAGRKRTSKINGNSIFFPYSGYRSDSSFYTFINGVRSSSLDTSDPQSSWYLHFGSSGMYLQNYREHRDGLPVRGVL